MDQEGAGATNALNGKPPADTDANDGNGADDERNKSAGKGAVALALTAPLVLGAVAEWWGGLTGADSAVVAAVVPAVLTGGGGALLAIHMRSNGTPWSEKFGFVAAGVIVLSLGLVAGMHGALVYKEYAYERKRAKIRLMEQKEVIAHIQFRMQALEKCALGKVWLDWEVMTKGGVRPPPGALCDPALFVLPAPLK